MQILRLQRLPIYSGIILQLLMIVPKPLYFILMEIERTQQQLPAYFKIGISILDFYSETGTGEIKSLKAGFIPLKYMGSRQMTRQLIFSITLSGVEEISPNGTQVLNVSLVVLQANTTCKDHAHLIYKMLNSYLIQILLLILMYLEVHLQ